MHDASGLVFFGARMSDRPIEQNLYAPPQARVADPDSASPVERLTWAQILFSFEGRIPRKAFWLYGQLPLAAALVGANLLGQHLFGGHRLGAIAQLASVWPSTAIAVKRWHDHDRTGWHQLLALIPFVNLWVLVKLGFLRGSEETNRYGADATQNY